jgi:glycosyltransferase involved in cell wall biosynthesis
MRSNPTKVLWFTNTTSAAAEFLKMPTIGGGWINSLEEKIKETENIKLAVAFKHGKKKLNKFIKGNTTYYAIPNNSSKIKQIFRSHLNILSDDQLIAYCLEIIDDFEPDIINIFGTEAGFGLIISKIKIPVVIHLQGILTVLKLKWFSANINKIDLLFNSNIKSQLKANTLIHDYNYLKKESYRELQIFKICKHFMGRTDWDRRVTSILAPDAEYFISNEILRKEFYLNKWNQNVQTTKIFVSTIKANIYKGLETILESAILLKKINKFNFNWFVVGISANDLIIRLFEKKIGKQFKAFNIVFLGKMVACDLLKIELKADIFVHPSHIDNSPNSLCEAMLLGIPVIATCSGGTSSLLIDKKEGILIQDGDPYSMAGAILELVTNPNYAAELGQNARKRALNRHDPDSIVKNIINIYSKLLSEYESVTS